MDVDVRGASWRWSLLLSVVFLNVRCIELLYPSNHDTNLLRYSEDSEDVELSDCFGYDQTT